MPLQRRWDILKQKDPGLPSFRELYPGIPNADLWFKQNILNSPKGGQLLKSIEEYDAKRLRDILIEKNKKLKVDPWIEIRKKRNNLLQSTDWTQLSDAPIDTPKRKQYRAYRTYLRDLPSLYPNRSKVDIATFEQFIRGKR
jgi:hypothetical protein